jgi:hypothetical protein
MDRKKGHWLFAQSGADQHFPLPFAKHAEGTSKQVKSKIDAVIPGGTEAKNLQTCSDPVYARYLRLEDAIVDGAIL